MAFGDGFILICISLCMSLLKLLMVHSYRSTDYEVHRNWLAITHSLPLNKWYTENTSEWTLDYPPFFAWFEYLMSHVAVLFDPQMVKVSNLNYVSDGSILFHRLSVIVSDFVYLYAAYHFSLACVPKRDKSDEMGGLFTNPRIVVGVLLMTNFGLFIIDHIHFQYNGFMYGLLLLSIISMYQGRFVTAALHFATLLNFKHIYLYVAPAYGVYLLRVYCFQSSSKDGRVLWKTFSVRKFSMLAAIVVIICGMSLGPFIHLGQLNQVLSRLFPFKRGLCHAYWAPNFWTLYNMADKTLYTIGRRLDLVPVSNQSASMTGGLVQEFDHAVLPSIKPLATFLLTAIFMVPTLVHLWLNPRGARSFLRSLVMCAFTSFMFGWHVHEKAILLVIIPLALLALDGEKYARHFILLSTTANVSLLPLIFTQFEQPLLYFGLVAYTLYTWISLHGVLQSRSQSVPQSKSQSKTQSQSKSQLQQPRVDGALSLSLLATYEKLYLCTLVPVVWYYAMGHSLLGLNERLPFLPLLLMSVYTSVGVAYSYVTLYRAVLSENMIINIRTR